VCETDAPPWREAGQGHAIRCHIPVDELRALQSQGVSAPSALEEANSP
jgi:peptide/nickel transport system ATP-binding protein